MSEKSGQERLLDMLEQGIALSKTTEGMTNDEFAAWLLENAWADLEMDSPWFAVMSEVIDRLRTPERIK